MTEKRHVDVKHGRRHPAALPENLTDDSKKKSAIDFALRITAQRNQDLDEIERVSLLSEQERIRLMETWSSKKRAEYYRRYGQKKVNGKFSISAMSRRLHGRSGEGGDPISMRHQMKHTEQQNDYIWAIAKKWKPLSAEQEKALISRERHDEGHLRDLLFYHNMLAALNCSKMYSGGRLNSGDDAAQHALLGLFTASRQYDLDSNIKFITYATWRIIREITYPTRLASDRVDSQMVSLDAPLRTSEDDQDDFTLESIVSRFAKADYIPIEDKSPAAGLEQEYGIATLVEDAVNGLEGETDRNKSIFREYVSRTMGGEDETSSSALADIGEKHGISRQAADQSVKRMARRVRSRLLERYADEEEVNALRTNRKSNEISMCNGHAGQATVARDVLKARLRSRLYANNGLVTDYEKIANCTDVTIHGKKSESRDLAIRFYPESRNRYLHELFSNERRKMGMAAEEGRDRMAARRRYVCGNDDGPDEFQTECTDDAYGELGMLEYIESAIEDC